MFSRVISMRWEIIHRTTYTYASLVRDSFNEARLQPFSDEWQTLESFLAWAQGTPYLVQIHQTYFAQSDFAEWAQGVVGELVRVGAGRREGLMIHKGG